MQIRRRIPRARALARVGIVELSRAAQVRLRWLTHYQTHGRNIARTCRYFGLSRPTFYRWYHRYDPQNLHSLEERSHRPHRRRQPTWTAELAQAVLALRRQYPRWGKAKLAVLLARHGRCVSVSMVGRILRQLKQSGRLVEPRLPRQRLRALRRLRPWAVRKPRAWRVAEPGDLVQIDTLDVRPVPGLILKQFTARDVISRWDVVAARRRATSLTAAQFLDTLQARMPFPVRAVQVDGGSEFAAAFEQACQKRGLRLFVLPPHSPKLNGCVERAQRTHTEEFYQVVPCSWHLEELNRELRAWEQVYNTVRPHQALGYLTPQEFLQQWQSQPKEPHV